MNSSQNLFLVGPMGSGKSAVGRQLARRVQHVGLVQRLSDTMARCGDERIGNAATDNQRVDLVGQGIQHRELRRDLRTADNGDKRSSRSIQRLGQRIQFGCQERACAHDWRVLTHTIGTRLGAMRRAERIHDVNITKRRHLACEALVAFLLAVKETNVLEQHDLTRLDINAVDPVTHQGYVAVQQAGQVLSHGPQRKLVVGLPLGRAPQVRHDHDRRIRIKGSPDSRQGCPDARIAGHFPVRDGHVQIFTNENTFARQLDVGHLDNSHAGSSGAPISHSSTQWSFRACDLRSPTRCRTRR
mgnify:CR=1 FL=1